MFFRRDYAQPGPGVDPNAPEKTGLARLIQILELECVDLFKLNLIFVLSCIPVVTIPPALFAMDHVVRRMVLDKPVDLFYQYRTAFGKYWKTAYAAFFVTAGPMILAGYGVWFYLGRAAAQPLFFLPFTFCATVFVLTMLASTYLYGILTTDRTFRESVRLALMLAVARPLRAVLAAVCWYGALLIAVLEFPISAVYLLFMGFSVPCLLSNFYLRTVLKQFFGPDPKELEDARPNKYD